LAPKIGRRRPVWQLARSSGSSPGRIIVVLTGTKYALPRQIKPGILKLTLEKAKATLALSLFLLAAKKKVVTVSFRQDSSVLTVARTAGAATVCKE